MANSDYLSESRKAKHDAIKNGASTGPVFGRGATSFWNDQIFQSVITPEETVECGTPLHVGSHSGALYVALNAMPDNTEDVVFPKDSTITFTFLVGSDEDGEFRDIGPTVCVKAPEDGITVEPGQTAVRVALPDFPLPLLKLKLEFDGDITGGKLEAGLGYAAR